MINRRNAFRSIFETVRVQTYPTPLNVIIRYFSTQNPFHLRRTEALVNESNGSRKTSLRKVINRERGVL